MEYSRLPLLPILASIRRRLPRLYSSHNNDHLSGAISQRLSSSSEPYLPYMGKFEPTESQRPSTASDDLGSLDSTSGSDTPRTDEEGSLAKYEQESGLRWNRVVPAFNLLRNAGYEAQQPQGDSRLARSLYISALMYLLDALPTDLTPEETRMLEHRLPQPIKSSLATYPQTQLAQLDASPTRLRTATRDRSYLHKLLASIIVQLFILIRVVLPYAKLLLYRMYEYERSHRITERAVAMTLDAADGLGKRGIDISSAVCKLHEGRIGVLLGGIAGWWIEGIAGGIYDGVGEGMVHLGLLRTDLELDRMAIR
ncbi:hypothetical protein N7468_007598 [Penicillium chermesinum]|uniref:Uncharacterized protein n=1 Tax=Penicillium chermesinum TaxID=63820 RepID=A0A9W9NWR3_9EURO|nr:uncharacterized protein N7468_007598 [Penicillium chermesinum]KAJ5226373.1 hypothetical protein N7468_007598 [Penicillium chermesinum]